MMASERLKTIHVNRDGKRHAVSFFKGSDNASVKEAIANAFDPPLEQNIKLVCRMGDGSRPIIAVSDALGPEYEYDVEVLPKVAGGAGAGHVQGIDLNNVSAAASGLRRASGERHGSGMSHGGQGGGGRQRLGSCGSSGTTSVGIEGDENEDQDWNSAIKLGLIELRLRPLVEANLQFLSGQYR